VDPGRNPKGENRDAEGKRPQRDFKRKRAAYKMAIKDAKVGSLRNALKQGNPEDPGGLAYRLIKKRGAAATAWATIQDEEGIWAGNRTETAMALIRKYFPGDDQIQTPMRTARRESESSSGAASRTKRLLYRNSRGPSRRNRRRRHRASMASQQRDLSIYSRPWEGK
jgi:hypothetical protein